MTKQNVKCDYEEVIERLLAEQRQTREVLNQIEMVYRTSPEFDGLSLVGGIKAIIKRYHEEQDKVRKLEKELTTLQHKKEK